MILLWILFILIILISISLAYSSMKDFAQSPEDFEADNILFLVRKPLLLTPQIISSLYQAIQKKDLIISLERLFKGKQSALVIYGPRSQLEPLKSTLDLLELEDYIEGKNQISSWDVGFKKSKTLKTRSLFASFPILKGEEQVWYQMVLKAQKKKIGQFGAQLRVVVLAQSLQRRERLLKALLVRSHLVVIPTPYANLQRLEFYKKRSVLGRADIKVSGAEIINLWRLP